MRPSHRIPLTRWAVTALAEEHGRRDHHPDAPEPSWPCSQVIGKLGNRGGT
jgi:hypothetical protein